MADGAGTCQSQGRTRLSQPPMARSGGARGGGMPSTHIQTHLRTTYVPACLLSQLGSRRHVSICRGEGSRRLKACRLARVAEGGTRARGEGPPRVSETRRSRPGKGTITNNDDPPFFYLSLSLPPPVSLGSRRGAPFGRPAPTAIDDMNPARSPCRRHCSLPDCERSLRQRIRLRSGVAGCRKSPT